MRLGDGRHALRQRRWRKSRRTHVGWGESGHTCDRHCLRSDVEVFPALAQTVGFECLLRPIVRKRGQRETFVVRMSRSRDKLPTCSPDQMLRIYGAFRNMLFALVGRACSVLPSSDGILVRCHCAIARRAPPHSSPGRCEKCTFCWGTPRSGLQR